MSIFNADRLYSSRLTLATSTGDHFMQHEVQVVDAIAMNRIKVNSVEL